MNTARSNRYPTITLLIAIFLAAMLGLYFAVDAAGPPPEAVLYMGDILEAIDNYCLIYGRLPTDLYNNDGQAIGSWRFAISPLLESTKIDIDVGKSWNHPSNSRMAEMPFTYFCWPRETMFGHERYPSSIDTNVFTIAGPNTAFSKNIDAKGRDDFPNDLVLLISIADSNIHWMQPGDLELSEFPGDYSARDFVPVLSGAESITIAFADGKVWQLTEDVPLEVLGRFFTLDGAKNNRRAELLSDYCVFKKQFPYIGP